MLPDTPAEKAKIESGARAEWGNKIWGAVLYGTVVVVMLTLIVVALIFLLGNPPFQVSALTRPPTTAVCPGEQYEVWADIQTEKTVVIFVYITNKTPSGNHLVNPKQPTPVVIPVSGRVFFRQSFIWYVPNAPPGIYHRVFGFRGHDTDEEPLVFGDGIDPEGLQPFEIGSEEKCSAREKTT